ncbi:MAG: glutamate synthase subunit alpha, partial [Cellulomonadaceae bacterium]|nr:glutamate synthase subunit alpha [Cellulomonadaceae bacterium]
MSYRGGLYDPSAEHDSCGVAFVATLRGTPGRDIVDAGLTALRNLDHRGAVGAEENSGDGAGILTQIPDEFLREVFGEIFPGSQLPPAGQYVVGLAFFPPASAPGPENVSRETLEAAFTDIAHQEGLDVFAWREVPVDPNDLGPTARSTMPTFRQVVLIDPKGELKGEDLDRRAYRIRKRAQHELGLYFASLSCQTLVYKGMLTTNQLQPFFLDLSHPKFASEIALVHSRFSTNTFPSWPLAQPMRYVAHNGEINTIRGNRNWIAAREGSLKAPLLGDLQPLLPVCTPGASDSATFDEVLELLHLSGRSLPHAVLMMIPEAWEHNEEMDPARKAFYDYHLNLMEPWDGPAALTFTDGTLIGAVLDRNGLRPARYWVTDDGFVVLASETGVLDIPAEKIVRKGRLEPGKMFLVDTKGQRIIEDSEIKAELAAQKPYEKWLNDYQIPLETLPKREHIAHSPSSVERRQRAFGYTREELRLILTPMANTGAEPLGAMGT